MDFRKTIQFFVDIFYLIKNIYIFQTKISEYFLRAILENKKKYKLNRIIKFSML